MANELGNEAGDRDGAEGASGAERLTSPADEVRKPRLPFPVVGIGASAGGLEAYIEFLQACPADTGMAYVLVQHLPPDRESMLVEILAKNTLMPVTEVVDGQTVEPNRVYVIRPGHTLTMKDGRLHLGAELAARGHGRPVDDLFRSLAEEQQQRAVAVVFSGMGSNGTAGAEAVKAVGGLVIAQEPESAKFPSMPRSLIDTHLPDFILRPSEVPDLLVRYAGQTHVVADAPSLQDEPVLTDVLAVLRTRTRHDFSGYRKPTILRRIRRRMGLGQFTTIADYLKALRQTPAEVTALADDLLIHVTGFFRDPEVWAVLREKVLDPLVAERPDGAEVRCWVSACATGEEAYSLAMLITEASEMTGKRFDVKVFATDMAERALGAARAGVFPNGIESEVSPERLARFFDKDDCFYRVKKELRELVIFAPQNVLQDPPFSRLDIVTCRNLLIYLEPATQRRVLTLLHFGLREGGTLMLGSSESPAPAERDFEPIDKKYRIYRRVGPTRAGTLDLPAITAAVRGIPTNTVPVVVRPSAMVAAQLVGRALLDRYTPPAVAVDEAGQIVHVHGDTARFLVFPAGAPSLDLLSLANEQVRGAVRTALQRSADGHVAVTVRDGLIETPAGRRRVEVSAAPLGSRGTAPMYLVTFSDYPEPSLLQPAGGDTSTTDQFADELRRTRNELHSAMEEMQASNEELKASNEEAMSLNEELQSTNEELETSKEEMQSLNEELVTVNAQLLTKMCELESTANDMGSLLSSTDIAVLFLDPRFRIRRFTPAVRDLIDLIPSDIGRPIADLRRKFTDPELLPNAKAVLDKLIPIEKTIESESNRYYLRRILPFRTRDDRIDGVVVAFVDITEQRKAEADLRLSEAKYRSLFESIDEGFCLLEILFDKSDKAYDYVLLEANAAFERQSGLFGAVGRSVLQLIPGFEAQWVGVYGRVVKTGEPIRFQADVASMARVFDVYAFNRGNNKVAAVFNDITGRKRAEANLAFLAEVSMDLVLLKSLGETMHMLGAKIGVHFGATRIAFFEFDMAVAEAVCEYDWHAKADDASLVGNYRTADFYTDPEDFISTLRAGKAFVLGDGTADGRIVPKSLVALGIGSLIVVPTDRDPGMPLVVLSLNDSKPREWRVDEIDLMRELTTRIWTRLERARTEEALRLSEDRLRLAMVAARMGMWTLDGVEGRHRRDANLNRMLGLEAKDTVQPFEDYLAYIVPDDAAKVRSAFAGSMLNRQPLNIEFRIVQPDGTVRWLRDQGDVFGDFVAGAQHMAGACVDVTELKKFQTALQDSHNQLELRVAERTAELEGARDSLEAEMVRRRDLTRRISTAQEDERRRVARDLHDTVGQLMTGLALTLKTIEGSSGLSPQTVTKLHEAQRVMTDLGREVHGLAVRLRPTSLDDLGLETALEQLVDDWTSQYEISAECHVVGLDRMPQEIETAIYRIVQEALTNIAKHAKASAVDVVVTMPTGFVSVVVEDDGVGFDSATTPKGRLGLLGMRERVALVGGGMEIESRTAGGTTLIVQIPLTTT